MRQIGSLSAPALRLLVAFLLGADGLDTAEAMVGGFSRSSRYRAMAELVQGGWIKKEGRGRVPTLPWDTSHGMEVLSSGSSNMDNIFNYEDHSQTPPSSAPPPSFPGLAKESMQGRVAVQVPESGTRNPEIRDLKSQSVGQSQKVGLTVPESGTFDSLLDACLEADDLPAGDYSMRPGSPFVQKRKAQTKALQAVWAHLFPGQAVLSHSSAGILIKTAGESAYLVGVCLQDTAEKGERITAPFPYAKKAIESAVRAGWLRPERASDESDLAAPTPEFLAQLAETKRQARELWGEEE